MAKQGLPVVGTVEPSTLYKLTELQQRTGCGPGYFRAARRRGLPVKYAGRTAFVLGADFIADVQRHGKNQK